MHAHTNIQHTYTHDFPNQASVEITKLIASMYILNTQLNANELVNNNLIYITCRVCVINAVDGSNITCYNVHEFDSIGRAGSRTSRVLISGHSNGGIQVCMLPLITLL